MTMFEWLSKLDDGVIKIGFLAAGAALVLMTWAIASAWRAVRVSDHRTRLTAMMLERSMPAEEIRRVLLSSPDEAAAAASGDPEVRVVKHLTDNHYEADDVEKVLAALRECGEIDESAVQVVAALAESWSEADDIANVLRRRRTAGRTAHQPSQSETRPAVA